MFLFKDLTLIEIKKMYIFFKKIYGVSWYKSNLISIKLGFSNFYYSNNLNDYFINIILYFLKGFLLSDTYIKRIIDNNITRFININNYKGWRHKLNLPVRGQRTRTNAGTQRSKRKKMEIDIL